jgi:hypothetical protein
MMMRTRLVTHATERFVRARHERRIAHDCVRAFSFVPLFSEVLVESKIPRQIFRRLRARNRQTSRRAISPFAMDDLEFDFEDEINATDVGQPQQAPETLPERAKKNYRQVRATHAGAPESERAHSFDRRSAPKQP